jgi:NAD(P)H-dependent FMN reductase
MSESVKILAISGSLRRQSYNTTLLHAIQTLAIPGITLEIATLHGIPLYDGDLEEKEGIPQAVSALKERIIACDGLLLATPEYNNGIPGVFKNAIDWLSRTDSDRIFSGRTVALIGASPGGFGTILSQNAWLPVLRTLKTNYWTGGRLMVSRAHTQFDEQGGLKDENLRKQVREFVEGFAGFVAK